MVVGKVLMKAANSVFSSAEYLELVMAAQLAAS